MRDFLPDSSSSGADTAGPPLQEPVLTPTRHRAAAGGDSPTRGPGSGGWPAWRRLRGWRAGATEAGRAARRRQGARAWRRGGRATLWPCAVATTAALKLRSAPSPPPPRRLSKRRDVNLGEGGRSGSPWRRRTPARSGTSSTPPRPPTSSSLRSDGASSVPSPY
jgi:hypothetical protein